MIAESDLLRMPRQRLRRHDRRLHLRLLPFVVAGVLVEQRVGDDEAEHRIAEEFQRLVVGDAAGNDGGIEACDVAHARAFFTQGGEERLGADAAAVLQDLLRADDDRIAALIASGALGART